MEKDIYYSRLNKVLKTLALKENKQGKNIDNLEYEAQLVFSSEQKVEMPQKSQKELFRTLHRSLKDGSLGKLVRGQSEKHEITVGDLSEETGLAEDIIENIIADNIFPNSIPIHSLKKLFRKLHIGFQEGEVAIRRTFDILMQEVNNAKFQLSGIQPSFRRGAPEEQLKYESGYAGGRANNLYRNTSALNKYIDRLEVLLKE